METNEMLDLLAEFYSQRDSVDAQKRALLDDVKVPAEIEQIVSDGMKRMGEIEHSDDATRKTFDAMIEKELADVVIPEDIRAALAEIDAKRAAIQAKKRANEDFLSRSIAVRKQELQAEIDAKVKDTYAAVAQRRREIEIEFSGKVNDANANIAELEKRIKDAVKAGKKTVKGTYFTAVYMPGRITWNTDKMEAWIVDHPFLQDARKEGEPSVAIRPAK